MKEGIQDSKQLKKQRRASFNGINLLKFDEKLNNFKIFLLLMCSRVFVLNAGIEVRLSQAFWSTVPRFCSNRIKIAFIG